MLPTAFDHWLAATLDREGTFTMFLILFEDAPGTIVPVRSSYLHVIGPDLRWDELAAMVAQAEAEWSALAVCAAMANGAGAPLPDVEAQARRDTLQLAVLRDRLTVRKGELFDRGGRRLQLQMLAS